MAFGTDTILVMYVSTAFTTSMLYDTRYYDEIMDEMRVERRERGATRVIMRLLIARSCELLNEVFPDHYA